MNAVAIDRRDRNVVDGIVREPTLDGEPRDGTEHDWTKRLAGIMGRSPAGPGSRLRTTLSCNVRNGRPVLFLPPEMGNLQPRSLAWLSTFARRHGFGLVEDRRRVDIGPLVDKREAAPSGLSLGLGLLLRQSGMPGGLRTLSTPHRLAADGLHVELDELVRMAARVRDRSKRVVMLPNRLIARSTGNDTHPITGRACRVETAGTATVVSQFESPSFRCIGYSTERQYVLHVFLAGGLKGRPELWTRLHTLTHTDFRFRLFPGERGAHDFGLFHATFYLDVAGDDAAADDAVTAAPRITPRAVPRAVPQAAP